MMQGGTVNRGMALGLFLFAAASSGCCVAADDDLKPEPPALKKPVNIVYILCDDLGIGELGCYGQEKIQTPNIDALAASGMRFTRHYSGSTVCAPSRCALMTGKHTGHTFVRGNREIRPEGQVAIPENSATLASALKAKGYATACIGKWGLGGVGTSGDPLNQGFEHFYGYNCQRHAHSYYPGYLWNDDKKVTLDNNGGISGHGKLEKGRDPMDPQSYARFIGKEWSPDLMSADMVQWMEKTAKGKRPFFLYYATPLPHVAIQVPPDRVSAELAHLGDEKPYTGNRDYLPTRYPHAGYAAMVRKIDDDVGLIVKTVKALGLEENTLIVFSSDNGPTFNGGTDSRFFKSARNARGLKCDLLEGGIRVPMIAAWPGVIAPGTESDHLSAMWDVYPTVCDLTGAVRPADLDGVSFLPTLLGKPAEQKTHDLFYWENHENKKCVSALRVGDYKLIRHSPAERLELYNLADDPSERKNLAETQKEKCAELFAQMKAVRTESDLFPMPKKQDK